MCGRRSVSPHHLLYRALGGGDELENMASLCFDCHIGLIHTGRLKALPPASSIVWLFGPANDPIMRVEGRRRVLLR